MTLEWDDDRPAAGAERKLVRKAPTRPLRDVTDPASVPDPRPGATTLPGDDTDSRARGEDPDDFAPTGHAT